jgi:hypothetical protein
MSIDMHILTRIDIPIFIRFVDITRREREDREAKLLCQCCENTDLDSIERYADTSLPTTAEVGLIILIIALLMDIS